MNTLTLVRGLPGSGKSYIAQALELQDFETYHFEADMWFDQFNDGVFDPNKLQSAHSWCREQTRECLKDGLSVVVSNTFTRLWEMKPYLDMALELGVQLQVVTVQGNFGSVHGVPETTMDKMKQRFEPFDLNYWLENHNETKRS